MEPYFFKGIKIIGYDSTDRFNELFVSDAWRIEFGPPKKGMPVEIYIFDKFEDENEKVNVKRVYVWENRKFVEKNSR